MERKKSLARAKTSAVSIADILVKEGVSLLIPGYGLIHEFSKIGAYFGDSEHRFRSYPITC